MEFKSEGLPSILSRWLGSLTDLLGLGLGAALKSVPARKRREIIKARLAENREIRELALRQREVLLSQLEKIREVDLEVANQQAVVGNQQAVEPLSALPVPPSLENPDQSLIDTTPVFSGDDSPLPDADDSGEVEFLDQDMSMSSESQVLDVDENGERLVVENELTQFRQRDAQGRERFVTQMSSKVYEGSSLVGRSDYLAKLSLDPGNVVKVRFSDGSTQEAVFTGKFEKADPKSKGSSGGGSSVGSHRPSSSRSGGPRPIVAFVGSPRFAISPSSITANVTKKISSRDRTRDRVKGTADQDLRPVEEPNRSGEEPTDFRTTTGAL